MKNSLSHTDIQFARHVLGRMPSDEELNVIAAFQRKYLKGRLYTETLNRLDDGIKRTRIPEEDLMDENGNHMYFFSTLAVGEKIVENIQSLLEAETRSTTAVHLNNNFKNNDISISAGLVKTGHPTELQLAPAGSIVGFISLPSKRISKAAKKRIAGLLEHSWVLGTRIVDQYKLPQSIATWCTQDDIGVTLKEDIFGIKSTGLLLVVQHGFKKELLHTVKDWKEQLTIIGSINEKQEIHVAGENGSTITLPIDVLRFPWRVYSQTRFHREELKVDKSLPDDIEKDFTKIFKKLWNEENSQPQPEMIAIEDDAKSSKQWVMATSYTHRASTDYPRLAGQLAVADATRNLASVGAKFKGVIIRNIFHDSNDPEDVWYGFEVIQGQEESIRSLHLPILNRSVTTLNHQQTQAVFAVGNRQKLENNQFTGFVSNGDFISILGSHRGELGYSTYMDLIHNNTIGHLPACDLNMESRIQEAVVQGIQTKLIKSATPLGRGGLAITIAKELKRGNQGLGARIHFSRKLRNDQMLFGETQGLVLISLGEEDIMEFERICMSIGVPSTTIGRVTDTGRFTFNEFFDIKVMDF